jgi:hypothetical protein
VRRTPKFLADAAVNNCDTAARRNSLAEADV